VYAFVFSLSVSLIKYKIIMGKSEDRRILGRSRRRIEDNIKVKVT